MHPVDRFAALMIKHGPRRLRIFPGGWGDATAVQSLGDVSRFREETPEIAIAWKAPRNLPDRVVRDGRFETFADVPAEARIASIRVIEPLDGAERMCLLMAAWNDHGYGTRERLALELVNRGIGSVMLENPYYGGRRVMGPDEQPVHTVADFARMGFGAVAEGRALLHHFRGEHTMGVAGYSMGGNISALVGAAAGFPVAMAPLAPSHSPGPVFLEGVISRGIQWSALGGVSERGKLTEALGSVSVLRLPTPEWASAAVLVAGRSDGFVPSAATRQLHEHWVGSELRIIGGGHATMLVRQRPAFAEAIADSFNRLTER